MDIFNFLREWPIDRIDRISGDAANDEEFRTVESWEEVDFVARFRMTKATFHHVLAMVSPEVPVR